jgi:hypothetical protein
VHPLAAVLADAAEGRFPPVDGGWRRVPPWRPDLQAILSFTGHAILAVDPAVADERLAELGVEGFGGAHDPRVVTELAGTGGWIDSLDALLVGRGTGGPVDRPPLVPRPDLADHPRVRFARAIRADVRVLGYPDPDREAVAVICRGLAGLTEISFELEPDRRRSHGGTALVGDALGAIPRGRLVVAAAAPGNAASLRALLAAGFVPVGSLQLFRPVGVASVGWTSDCRTRSPS